MCMVYMYVYVYGVRVCVLVCVCVCVLYRIDEAIYSFVVLGCMWIVVASMYEI